MPKVSVIIPIYGVEKYIERCARSLFEQTLDDIEFIFVNDCTKDSSIEILQTIIEEYPFRKHQIRIENMPTNSGQAAVRRHGIQLATGDYIIHCDSDDWVEISMYELMYKKAISEKLDMVICDYYNSDGNTHLYRSCRCICNSQSILSDFISQKTSAAVWNKLIKKELYSNNQIIYPSYNMGEDLALIIQIAMNSKKIGYIDKPLYYYFLNPISITKNTSMVIKENNWYALKENTMIVISCVKKKYKSSFNKEIKELIAYNRNLIFPYIQEDKKYKKLWLYLYPNINFWTEFGIRNKLRYLLIYFNLYTIFLKLKNKI